MMNVPASQPASTQPSSGYSSKSIAHKSASRDVKAEVESIDKIVMGSTLPFQNPLKVRQADAQWSAEHPAKVGNADELTFQIRGGEGANAAIEFLRNGSSEFQVSGTQGSHDLEHIFFESAWEQVGGKPLVPASPINEILVNDFEWTLADYWREGRIDEMNQIRARAGKEPHSELPTDEDFLDFQISTGRDGMRQLVHQTIASSPPAKVAFQIAGREPASFPNATELDWTMRAVVGDKQPLECVLDTVRQISSDGLALARKIGEQQPEWVKTVNEVGNEIEALSKVDGAHRVVSSQQLSFTPEFLEDVKPLVERMNENIAKIPAVYRHGLGGEVNEKAPVLPYYLAD
jgi:hypothetical protein